MVIGERIMRLERRTDILEQEEAHVRNGNVFGG